MNLANEQPKSSAFEVDCQTARVHHTNSGTNQKAKTERRKNKAISNDYESLQVKGSTLFKLPNCLCAKIFDSEILNQNAENAVQAERSDKIDKVALPKDQKP